LWTTAPFGWHCNIANGLPMSQQSQQLTAPHQADGTGFSVCTAAAEVEDLGLRRST
jgi:hypothetical protein